MRKKAIGLALLTGVIILSTAPVKTQAASAWSFKSGTEYIEKDGSTTMTYQQYKNFDLLKNDKLITDAADTYDDYKVIWRSSNEDAVWINKHTGQARANKFNTLTEDEVTVTISAIIRNTKTGKQIVRSFTVEVDNREFTKVADERTPEPEVIPEPDTVEPTSTPPAEEQESESTATTSHNKKGIKKLTLGSTWQTDVAVLLETFDFYYDGKVLQQEHIAGVESVDCVTIGTPATKIYIRSISLRVKMSGINPEWSNPEHYIVGKVEIDQNFTIE